jgi:hypothetical protein
MKTTDFTRPSTSRQLNENMYKKFGVKVNFDKYTREQLENYRNLLRTKLHQQEVSANFNQLLSNEGYQKDKHLVGVLNQRIKEMLGESIHVMERAVSKAQQQAAGVALAAKRSGKKPTGKGASAEMAKMSTKELEKFAGTKHKGLPAKKSKAVEEGAVDDAKDKQAAGKDSDWWGDKEKPAAKTSSSTRKVAGKSYGGSASKDDKVEESEQTMSRAAESDDSVLLLLKKFISMKSDPDDKQAMLEVYRAFQQGMQQGFDTLDKQWVYDLDAEFYSFARRQGVDLNSIAMKHGVDLDIDESKQTMSRAAKGYEKYGKQGMQALAKAGKEGKNLDPIRKKYDKYDESAKPDFLDMDKDGDKKEPMKKAVADKKKGSAPKKGVNPFAKKESVEESKLQPTPELMKKVRARLEQLHDEMEPEEAYEQMADELNITTRRLEQLLQDKRFFEADMGEAWSHNDAMQTNHNNKVSVMAAKEQADKATDPKAKEFWTRRYQMLAKRYNISVKEGRMRKSVKESIARYIAENEEGKAKSITAGTDMVNDFTSWMTRVGQYQTKSMIELADAIRANFGQQEAELFKQSVAPALENALNSLTQAREEISNAVSTLAGEQPALDQIGSEMDSGMDDMSGDEFDTAPEDAMNAAPEDEFSAADAAAGGAEAAGRTRRESRELFSRKLDEAHMILTKLSK